MTQAVPDHSAELALLGCVLLNGAVFGSAWRFASRRMTASRSQAVLDAALLGYVVQYAAIGLPGAIGLLRPAVVVGTAMAASIALFVAAGRRRPAVVHHTPNRPTAVALVTFAAAVVVGFAYNQSDLPVLSNDALTYHFPAAAQWLQRGRIEVFPTWFFNPANGYSPLAGSTFVAWLMVPFRSDVLARFVQVPALLCVGIGVYRLCREVSAGAVAAAAVAAAAVLCRPLLTASLMGKDDLFVAFAFVASLVALSPRRAAEPWAAVRLGLAVGLLLATKYTALLAVPLLMVAVDGPVRGGWRWRRWATAVGVAAVMAGPWTARTWIATGNPLFPVAVPHLFHGLFTAARSVAFATADSRRHVVLGGSFGVPWAVAIVAMMGWAVAVARLIVGSGVDPEAPDVHPRLRPWKAFAETRRLADPIARACVVGPPVGVALFFWLSPFPEVRFLFPAVLLLLATVGIATVGWARGAIALTVAAVATVSVSRGWAVFAWLVPVAAGVAVVVAWADWATSVRRWLRRSFVAVPVIIVATLAYVRWTAFCRERADQWTSPASAWAVNYQSDQPLWQFVNRSVPADAVVAYADLYLVYPLQGPTLRRRLVYVPTRHGVRTPADLPWLGDHLPGERLVEAASAATVADPDHAAWLGGLRRLNVTHLAVGRLIAGPEAGWADADPNRFPLLYTGPAGRVYAVHLGPVTSVLAPPNPPASRDAG